MDRMGNVDMKEAINIILSSAVIVALITAVTSFLQNREKGKIENITKEREMWRTKIRELAESINGCIYNGENEKNIDKYLIQLKVRINPYGKAGGKHYLNDANIWYIIDKLEKSENEEEFNRDKASLIYSLSFMLKEDWERSKREIAGNTKSIYKLIAFSCISIYLGYLYATKSTYGGYGFSLLIILIIGAFGVCFSGGIFYRFHCGIIIKNGLRVSKVLQLIFALIFYAILVMFLWWVLYNVARMLFVEEFKVEIELVFIYYCILHFLVFADSFKKHYNHMLFHADITEDISDIVFDDSIKELKDIRNEFYELYNNLDELLQSEDRKKMNMYMHVYNKKIDKMLELLRLMKIPKKMLLNSEEIERNIKISTITVLLKDLKYKRKYKRKQNVYLSIQEQRRNSLSELDKALNDLR